MGLLNLCFSFPPVDLIYFNVSHNLFSSHLPCSIALQSLTVYDANSNAFGYSIPSCFENISSLVSLNVGKNQLTSSLPRFGLLPNLAFLNAPFNQLTGDLDDIFGPNLVELWLQNNLLMTTIPSSIATSKRLMSLRLQDNSLFGSLPATISHQPALTGLFLYGNNLTGGIETLIGSSTDFSTSIGLRNLTHVDISTNRFTGTLPSELFQTSLVTFVASSNCFSGTLPASLCNATNLEALLLDGLSTSSSCLSEIFPDSPYFHTFKIKSNNVYGTVPACLYDLPRIQALHISGNAFSGTLPSSAALSWSLRNLSVSHNLLHEPIPFVYQVREWDNFDVSYNQFRGVLLRETPFVASNGSYHAEVNRLSGWIPPRLKSALNISILEGNVFACDFGRETEQLPTYDPKRVSYNCGSDPVNYSLAFWTMVVLFLILIYLLFIQWTRTYDIGATPSDLHRTIAKLDGWLNQLSLPAGLDRGGLQGAKNLFRTIKRLFVAITSLSLVFLMPLNAGLTTYFSTMEYPYIWVTSSVFLTGWIPAFWLVLAFSAVLLTCWLFLSWRRKVVERSVTSTEKSAAFYTALSLINVIVMGTVDVVYVVGINKYGGATQFSIVVALGIFKFCWNEGFIMGMFLTMKAYFYYYFFPAKYDTQRAQEEARKLLQRQSVQEAGDLWRSRLHPNGSRSSSSSSRQIGRESLESARWSQTSSLASSVVDDGINDCRSGSLYSMYPGEPSLYPTDSTKDIRFDEEKELTKEADTKSDSRKGEMAAQGDADEKSERSTQDESSDTKRSIPVIAEQHSDPVNNNNVFLAEPINISALETQTKQQPQLKQRTSWRTDPVVLPRRRGDSLATNYTIDSLDEAYQDSRGKGRKYTRSYDLKTDVIFSAHDVAVITFNLVVNTVLLPSISVLFASTNCFYHIFYPAKTIPSVYSYNYCAHHVSGESLWSSLAASSNSSFTELSPFLLSTKCPQSAVASNTIHYNAPFTYSYMCASNIITFYSEAFILQTIVLIAIVPVTKLMLKMLNSYLTTQGDHLCCAEHKNTLPYNRACFCCCYYGCCAIFKTGIQSTLPNSLWTLRTEPPKEDFVFFDQTFIPRVYSLFSILLVYGVIFPPLACTVCCAALVVTYNEEVLISRLITKAKKQRLTWVLLRLQEECQGLEHRFTHPTLIWLLMLSVCPIYTFLIFDTAGDKYGWEIGIIPASFMFALPSMFYIVRKLTRYGKKRIMHYLAPLSTAGKQSADADGGGAGTGRAESGPALNGLLSGPFALSRRLHSSDRDAHDMQLGIEMLRQRIDFTERCSEEELHRWFDDVDNTFIPGSLRGKSRNRESSDGGVNYPQRDVLDYSVENPMAMAMMDRASGGGKYSNGARYVNHSRGMHSSGVIDQRTTSTSSTLREDCESRPGMISSHSLHWEDREGSMQVGRPTEVRLSTSDTKESSDSHSHSGHFPRIVSGLTGLSLRSSGKQKGDDASNSSSLRSLSSASTNSRLLQQLSQLHQQDERESRNVGHSLLSSVRFPFSAWTTASPPQRSRSNSNSTVSDTSSRRLASKSEASSV